MARNWPRCWLRPSAWFGLAVVIATLGQVSCGHASGPQTAATDDGSPQAAATSTQARPGLTVESLTPGSGGSPASDLDLTVAGEAVTRLQSYLDTWRTAGLIAAGTMVVENQRAKRDDLQLLSGTVTTARVARFTSNDNFVLLVTLDLHFPNKDGAAWGEGTNTRFVEFSRPHPSDPFTMSFSSSPP